MAGLEINKLFGRLAGKRAAAQVADGLAGEQAQMELLREAGYPGQVQGLLQRLAVELNQAMPLHTALSDVRAFNQALSGATLLAQARREAGLRLPPPPPGGPPPASQVRLAPEEAHALHPWSGGGRFLRLCQAYLISGDDDLAEAASLHLQEFCAAFPPLMGAAWSTTPLLAKRALNWLWGLRLLAAYPRVPLLNQGQPGMTALVHLRIMAAILENELVSRRGDWRPADVGAAGALLFMGRCLGFMPESEGWMELGRQTLGPALGAWAKPGASPSGDQAAGAAEWGALCLWLGARMGWELPGVMGGLRHLAGLCRAAALPWGGLALWGHAPDFGALDFGQGPESAHGQAANLAALVLSAPELRGARLPDQRLFWIFGPEVDKKLGMLAGEPPPGAGDWPGAGLTALCGVAGQTRVGAYLRSGPRQADAPADAAQALALALAQGGQPLLVTPGPSGEGPLGPHLASREAMSAPRIDGQDPQGGVVELEGLEGGPRHLFVAASYNGYAFLPDPVLLRRRVHLDLEAGLLNVVDQVQSQGKHVVEVFFHLPPGTQVKELEPGAFMLEGPFGMAVFKPEPKAQTSLVQGRANPPLGWVASEPGQVKAAPVLRVAAQLVGSARLVNTLALDLRLEVSE